MYSVTFRNVGQYPITIGNARVEPGQEHRQEFEQLPEGCEDGEVLEIELRQPEQEGVRFRDPRTLIELAHHDRRKVHRPTDQ